MGLRWGGRRQCSPSLYNTGLCGTALTLTNYNDRLARWKTDSPRTGRAAEDSAEAAKLVPLGPGGESRMSNRGCASNHLPVEAPCTKES